jgi:ABC-type microcin C transport system duplicated ATPase subunit YejF
MLDNMIVEIAAAQQQDRRKAMAHEAKIAEALRGSGPREAFSGSQRRRAAIASALRALAFRLAPPQEEPATTMRRSAGAQS